VILVIRNAELVLHKQLDQLGRPAMRRDPVRHRARSQHLDKLSFLPLAQATCSTPVRAGREPALAGFSMSPTPALDAANGRAELLGHAGD